MMKYASVLEEYAMRYGENVKGWWIDGCYAGGVVALDIKVYNDGSFDPAQLEALKVVGRRTGTLKR